MHAASGASEVDSWNLIVSETEKKFKQPVVNWAAMEGTEVADVCSEITNDDVNRALTYWYMKWLAKIAVEKNGILFSRSRIMDGHRFIVAADFHKTSVGKEVQLDLLTPVPAQNVAGD